MALFEFPSLEIYLGLGFPPGVPSWFDPFPFRSFSLWGNSNLFRISCFGFRIFRNLGFPVVRRLFKEGVLDVRCRSAFAKPTARQSSLRRGRLAKTGGKGIRTPDIQLAKLALYQLSYAPAEKVES